jgi:TonB-like protein
MKPRWSTLGAIASVAFTVVALATVHAVAESPAAPPTQDSASLCSITVGSAVPVSPVDGAATTYLVTLDPPAADAKVAASGAVSLFTREDRYDVPFHDADIRRHQGSEYAGTVLAVRFPAPVRLEGGYVSSLTSPGTVQCAPRDPFMPTVEHKPEPPAAPAPSTSVNIDAPMPVSDPMPACAVYYAQASTVKTAPLQTPSIVQMNGDRQIAFARVRIAPNGSVISATIARPSHSSLFDDAVVHAAERSTYTPAIFRCVAVGGDYLFGGVFDPPR